MNDRARKSPKNPFSTPDQDPFVNEGRDTTSSDPEDKRENESKEKSEESLELIAFYPNVKETILSELQSALDQEWSLDSIDLSPVAESDRDPESRLIRISFLLKRQKVRSLFNVIRVNPS